ncbi:2-C-methyl-D-erythritol 2,4-cyclodiphosphate synthase [Guillardia theta CCMP2712]|uniref:2-C-methyl-D-erythritol 2,4-cyclodiphosphate synthase n=1 Tax=Guillardia theta (strain CCMP2712) TaxID=905079 RepID=L1IUG2_GUITC|nr:2-C-methyl-D-erythritol 2,4-cyclodiphosphate synthase [Guillardia theta CCMP2712]EKX39858.1 2-C-methyl-D-erythritol 2,4-cyclodiphosphate synthase [Guillardia theta CCMP2712]|eukprot:XP_005826838.1 2-C-methyl-D-erythritol 2,4-cyclodiphosphate synthase [Guillardia theta CCMP2712]
MAMVATSEGFSLCPLPLSLGWKGGRTASSSRASASRSHGLRMAEPAFRIGHGFDIHRLAPLEVAGQGCVIGGVKVENFELGTEAHSDGDVLYHSVTDAILGALSLPDIGQLFPDTDPKWKGCDSEKFLAEAWKLMDERGYQVSNLDVTLILERPKVSPIKSRMEDNLSRVLKAELDVVNVKARTHEKVDSIGEGRAMACHAVILMEKKAK